MSVSYIDTTWLSSQGHIFEYLKLEVLFNIQHTSVETSVLMIDLICE